MASSTLPQLVVIEGVDGVGKTTLAERLKREYGYRYIYPVPHPFDLIRKEIEILNDVEARFWFYLAGNITLQQELRKILASGTRVVLDRYVYSTMASHRAKGSSVDCIQLSKVPFIAPDLAILLTCAPEVRNKRILGRKLERQEYVDREGSILNATERFLREYPFKIIDTTNLTEEEVFAKAEQLLLD